MSSSEHNIDTARLLLRPFAPGDASAVQALGLEKAKAAMLPDWAHGESGAAELIGYFARCWQTPDPHAEPLVWAVVLRVTGEVIGHAGFGPKEELGGEVELGYAVSERHAGRGLATEAARAAVWWAFERCGLAYLAAIVLPENAASARVLDKLGFVSAGSRDIGGCGGSRCYNYFRFYRLDSLTGPEWRPVDRGESMGAFFDRRADGYEDHMLASPGAESSYRESVEPVDATQDAIEVLDLGCGTGLELRWLFERAPNARVTCVDLSEKMLDKLKSNHSDKLSQITPIQASYVDWEYPEGEYDCVLSVNTMHHFTEPVKLGIYRNIRKALKPGGKYVESDFIVDDIMMEQYRRRYRRMMEAAGQRDAVPGTLHADIPMTPMLQKELLRNAGFARVVSCRESIQPEHSWALLAAER